MEFKEAFEQANKILTNWGEKGVEIAGETEEDWLFKGHVINGDDILTGNLILVSKNDGSMRLYNAGYRKDRDAIRTAKVIDF